MSRLTIDVKNRAGTLQGPGPITTAVEMEYTRRLNRAGSFSFRVPKRDDRTDLVYSTVGPKASVIEAYWDGELLFRGIVENLRTTLDNADNIYLQCEGRDMLAELSEAPVAFLDLSSASAGVTNGPAQILGAASTFLGKTWSLDATNGYSTTTTAVYVKFAGESALQALINVADHIGERFRMGDGLREIVWLRDDVPTATIRAIQGAGDPIAAESNDNICFIRSLEEVTDAYELVNRIYPHGSGIGETRLTLNPTTRSAPAGFTLNKANNYLENTTSVTALGATIGRYVQYKNLRPISNTDQDLQSAANALFDATLADLRRRDEASDNMAYSIEIFKLPAALRPGHRIRVIYEDDRYSVDDEFFVLEIATRIDNQGTHSHRLTVATTDQYPASDSELQAKQIEQGTVLSAHPQMNASEYRESFRVYVGEDQTDEKAEIRWWFGPGVVSISQVVWRFNLTELVSPSNTIGGTTTSTSSGGGDTYASEGGSSHSHQTNNHQHVLTLPYAGTSSSRDVVLASVGNGMWYTASSDEGDRTIQTDNSGGGSTTTSDTSHTHQVVIPDHTHDIDVGEAISTEFGIFRESAANTFVVADLEYQINGDGWNALDTDVTSHGSGWYSVDITSDVSNALTRPVQEGNTLEVRRKAAGDTGKTAMLSGAIEIRNTIQAIAYI